MFSLNPSNKDFLDSIDLILKFFGTVGGGLVFYIGYRRYVKEQVWKRNEFVASEIKTFTNDSVVKNAMFMLDWEKRYIQLFPDKPNYTERFAKVDRKTLINALVIYKEKSVKEEEPKFTENEVAIRDTFDHFFNYFERFYQFIDAGLLSKKELEPYLNYWINSLTNWMNPDARHVIYKFIDSYGFTGTQKLFLEFGKDIHPSAIVESTIQISPSEVGDSQ